MKFIVVFFALCAVAFAADRKKGVPIAAIKFGKRSVGYYAAPAAVPHVISSPAVVPHAVAAPIVAHAPVVAAVPSAVSHQSRVDLHSSPAVVTSAAVVPAVGYAAPYNHGYGYAAAPYNYDNGYYNSAPWAYAG